jgi:hypothetical protein
MNAEYRIEIIGSQFVVIDPWNEYLVQTFRSEEAANQAIAECKKEDAMWESAKLLVHTATEALMRIHEVDEDTASRLIKDATGG